MFTRTQFRPFLTWPLHCNILLSIHKVSLFCASSACYGDKLNFTTQPRFPSHRHQCHKTCLIHVRYNCHSTTVRLSPYMHSNPLDWRDGHSTGVRLAKVIKVTVTMGRWLASRTHADLPQPSHRYVYTVHTGRLMRWLQHLRFDCDLTAVVLLFDCNSIALRAFDDIRYDGRQKFSLGDIIWLGH